MSETGAAGPLSPLPRQQTQRIIYAALLVSDPEPQTAEELQQVLEWADNARADYAALTLVLDGKIGACMKDGELGFMILSDGNKRQLRDMESESGHQ